LTAGLSQNFDVLKQRFPEYEDRPGQREMAAEVLRCLREKTNLLIEAGTGIGKSFAYLIPAVLSQEKTIVSTATLALQDQLVSKDLVFLQKELPQPFSFGILKGKNNYLCLKREREFEEISEDYTKFRTWVSQTQTGEKGELSFIPQFWSKVCGDSQDCNGRACPFYDDCFYYRHYRNLFKKDILVINHHLLIHDLLSEFNILPFHNHVIIDEASEIEDVVSHVMGTTISYSRLAWLLYRLKGMKILVDPLFAKIESFFKGGDVSSQTTMPIPVPVIEKLKDLKESLALASIVSILEKQRNSAPTEEQRDRAETTIGYVASLIAEMDDFIEQKDATKVYYMTGKEGTRELRSSLVEAQSSFRKLVDAYDSVIMTSATMAAGGSFRFVKMRLGTQDFQERIIRSPFHYQEQALLYVNRDLPAPYQKNDEAFKKESLTVIEELINASQGRALVLFTSYHHLYFVSNNINIAYPCKAQGQMSPARLIQWFKDTAHSVLLATATFWQGIDIKGEKLSLVVIVKLPFTSPEDPVYQERCSRLGDRWFSELALPSAILVLRQGFGRLIRGRSDFGVVAILDTRLLTHSYGNAIISSLPEMTITHHVADVKRFFDAIAFKAHQKAAKRVGNKAGK